MRSFSDLLLSISSLRNFSLSLAALFRSFLLQSWHVPFLIARLAQVGILQQILATKQIGRTIVQQILSIFQQLVFVAQRILFASDAPQIETVLEQILLVVHRDLSGDAHQFLLFGVCVFARSLIVFALSFHLTGVDHLLDRWSSIRFSALAFVLVVAVSRRVLLLRPRSFRVELFVKVLIEVRFKVLVQVSVAGFPVGLIAIELVLELIVEIAWLFCRLLSVLQIDLLLSIAHLILVVLVGRQVIQTGIVVWIEIAQTRPAFVVALLAEQSAERRRSLGLRLFVTVERGRHLRKGK